MRDSFEVLMKLIVLNLFAIAITAIIMTEILGFDLGPRQGVVMVTTSFSMILIGFIFIMKVNGNEE